MQFKVLATLTLLVAATSAIPTLNISTENTIEKRTCGTLSGTALTVCQDACKAACTLISLGIAASVCSSACTAGPL